MLIKNNPRTPNNYSKGGVKLPGSQLSHYNEDVSFNLDCSFQR